MPYATQQNMVDRFGEQELIELTDRADPPADAIDATVMARALGDADDEINSRIAARYTLPLASVPRVIVRVACDIARYYLYDDKATEQVTQRYKDALKFLADVASGKTTLGLDDADAVPEDIGGPSYSAPARTFSVGDATRGTAGTLDDYV